MRFPRIIVTTKLPAIIKLDALLRALRLHRPANIIKLLPIDANRRFKHGHFVRRPPLYARFPRDSLPSGETGMSSDDSCPRSFARSNRYCMAIVEKGYQLGVVQSVGNGAARVVNAADAVQIVLHLLAGLPEMLAVAARMEALHMLELGPGRGVEVCGRRERERGTESERAVETNVGLRLFVDRFLAVLLLGFGRGCVGGVVVARGLICGDRDGGRLRDLRLSLE